MKSKIFMAMFVIAASLLICSPSVMAFGVGSDFYMLQGAGGLNGGGSFDLYSGGGYLFTTFCETESEYFQPGLTYKVKGFETDISPVSAALYYHFRQGDLPMLGTDQADSYNKLQAAFWYLEGENLENDSVLTRPQPNGANNEYVALGITYGWNGIGNVRGLDYDWPPGHGYTAGQDVYTLVPEPATMLLLGLGLVGIGYLRRKFF